MTDTNLEGLEQTIEAMARAVEFSSKLSYDQTAQQCIEAALSTGQIVRTSERDTYEAEMQELLSQAIARAEKAEGEQKALTVMPERVVHNDIAERIRQQEQNEDDLIERVASAIATASGYNPNNIVEGETQGELWTKFRNYYRGLAKAVIEEIRAPRAVE